MNIKHYTGGLASTNAYAIESNDGWLAIDAPEGFHDFLKQHKIQPKLLVLTHGHWDHIWDAAAIQKEYSCPVYYHKADELICTHPEVMMMFGLPKKLTPIKATKFLNEGDIVTHGEYNFHIYHIPGHCPGSLCLYEKAAGILFAGDVLFAGTVGRTDLPGGSMEQLISGIKHKLLPLPDATIVYPGHGDPTTIGDERKDNPYLQ